MARKPDSIPPHSLPYKNTTVTRKCFDWLRLRIFAQKTIDPLVRRGQFSNSVSYRSVKQNLPSSKKNESTSFEWDQRAAHRKSGTNSWATTAIILHRFNLWALTIYELHCSVAYICMKTFVQRQWCRNKPKKPSLFKRMEAKKLFLESSTIKKLQN